MKNPKDTIYSIYAAAQKGDFESIIDICERFRDEDFNKAISDGYLSAIEKWLEMGEDVNAREPVRGKSPLMAAAQKLDVDVFRKFLSLGADVNHRDLGGKTALHYALDAHLKRTDVIIGEFDSAVTNIFEEMLKYQHDFSNKSYREGIIEQVTKSDAFQYQARDKVLELIAAYIESQQLNNLIDCNLKNNQNSVNF